MKKTIEILWTGGFDSTFRVCQLSKKDVIIQPYYLSDNRKSEQYELKAIESITSKLRSNKDTKATLKDYIYVPFQKRQLSGETSLAFSNLLKQDYMGSQYEWLSAFALDHKGIELSIHKDDKAILLISNHGKLVAVDDKYVGTTYRIDEANSDSDCCVLFGNFSLPLAKYTKKQMEKEYELMGMRNIMDDTWFCFNPINGKPCGVCNPCIYTIEEGMSSRFPQESLKRYNRRNWFFSKLLRKIKH